jgi:hypothetical protein
VKGFLAGAAAFAFAPEGVASAQTPTWAGVWDTTYGTLVLKQKGNEVTGVYNYDAEKSEIRATASGLSLKGVWDERPAECDTGPIDWTMAPDGLSFEGTWGPGCGSGGSWDGERTHIGLPLQVTVRTVPIVTPPVGAPEDPHRDMAVEVTVANLSDEPIEGVQVRGVSTKTIKTTCKKDPIKFPKSGADPSAGAPLAAGASRSVRFEYKEVCAGSAKVTGRAIAAHGVEVSASTKVKVSDAAYIAGAVPLEPVTFNVPLTSEDSSRLYRKLRIRAVGKRKTLTKRLTPDGTYSMKVPGRALGKYELSVTGNKAAETDPVRTTVTAARGKTATAKDLSLGYSCKVDPLGMDFTPVNGEYAADGTSSFIDVHYMCRKQRVRIERISFGPFGAEHEPLECVRSDGSTYEVGVHEEPPGISVLSGDRESRVSTAPLTNGAFEIRINTSTFAGSSSSPGVPVVVIGSFTGPRSGTLTMTHTECIGLNRQFTLRALD